MSKIVNTLKNILMPSVCFQRDVIFNCTPNIKLACFVCYLKSINTFSKNNTYTLKKIVHWTQKWH